MHHWLAQYLLIIDIYLYISLARSRLHLTSGVLCTRYEGTTINNSCIQDDSGGICTTLGNDSMSDSKQKSSCEHGSDFERLRSYGHFLIPIHALM